MSNDLEDALNDPSAAFNATITHSADEIVASAEAGLEILDRQIAQMRQQKKDIGAGIVQALEARKPLARIVSAARGRQTKSNGE